MNLSIRTILFIAAIVCFVIAIFSDVHWTDWTAIGLACTVGALASLIPALRASRTNPLDALRGD